MRARARRTTVITITEPRFVAVTWVPIVIGATLVVLAVLWLVGAAVDSGQIGSVTQ